VINNPCILIDRIKALIYDIHIDRFTPFFVDSSTRSSSIKSSYDAVSADTSTEGIFVKDIQDTKLEFPSDL
jgi:hypothetical protein